MHTTEEHKACQGHAGDTLKQTSAAHPFDLQWCLPGRCEFVSF